MTREKLPFVLGVEVDGVGVAVSERDEELTTLVWASVGAAGAAGEPDVELEVEPRAVEFGGVDWTDLVVAGAAGTAVAASSSQSSVLEVEAGGTDPFAAPSFAFFPTSVAPAFDPPASPPAFFELPILIDGAGFAPPMLMLGAALGPPILILGAGLAPPRVMLTGAFEPDIDPNVLCSGSGADPGRFGG